MTDRLNEEFLERIGPLLRQPEPLDPSLVERVVETARAERPGVHAPESAQAIGRVGWWRRRRTIQLSPLAAVALAASFAGVVCLATLGAAGALKWMERGSDRDSVPVAAATETVHVVRFTFARPAAQSVSLVGDFNAWTKDATPLVEVGEDGAWSVSVALRPGRHQYAFIVDGTEWIADPFAMRVNDDFGIQSSVVVVGDGGSAAEGSTGPDSRG